MTNLKTILGRERVTSAVNPSDAGYVRSINKQMQDISKELKKAIAHIENVLPESLEYAVKPIYDTSQVLVPVDTGKLRASGFIESRKGIRGSTVVIGYAKGGTPAYASIVHERLDFNHTSPTQAKFLEEAVNRHLNEISSRVVADMRNRTGITP